MKEIGLEIATRKRRKSAGIFSTLISALTEAIMGPYRPRIFGNMPYFMIQDTNYHSDSVLRLPRFNVYTISNRISVLGKFRRPNMKFNKILEFLNTNFLYTKKFICPLKHYVKDFYFV